jgi:hypothetical protein
MQQQDFANAYRAKTDDELVQLALDQDQLTSEALGTLTNELARRHIAALRSPLPQDEGHQPIEQQSSRGTLRLTEINSVSDFVEEVLRVYRSHFWVFIKLAAPAVAVGYISVMTARSEAHAIAAHIPRGTAALSHRSEILEMGLVNLAGYFASWFAFCVLFATICSAIVQIQQGTNQSGAHPLTAVRKRFYPFVQVSLLLFFLLLVAMAAAELADFGVFWFLHQRQVHPGRFAFLAVSYVTVSGGLLLFSRFSLAMPAVILDNYKVGKAIFRSDELTEGKWLILAVLLAKSLIGGYVAGVLPFWIRVWLWSYVQLPLWSATMVSIVAVTVVEPIMFIGFTLLYLQVSAASRQNGTLSPSTWSAKPKRAQQ